MPLFGSKFAPKRAPARKSSSQFSEEPTELVLEQRTIELKLGGQELIFENGQWNADTRSSGTFQKLKKKIEELEKENQSLKSKNSVMLNMLTKVTAENHAKDKELEKLRQHEK